MSFVSLIHESHIRLSSSGRLLVVFFERNTGLVTIAYMFACVSVSSLSIFVWLLGTELSLEACMAC